MLLPGDSTQPSDQFVLFLLAVGNLKIVTWISRTMTLHPSFIYFYFWGRHDSVDESQYFKYIFCWFIRAARLIPLTCRTNAAWMFVSRSHFQRYNDPWRYFAKQSPLMSYVWQHPNQCAKWPCQFLQYKFKSKQFWNDQKETIRIDFSFKSNASYRLISPLEVFVVLVYCWKIQINT